MPNTIRLIHLQLALVASTLLACQSLPSDKQQAKWIGRYSGQIPCASCSGIQMTVTLERDGRYYLLEEYSDTKGGRFASSGRYTQQSGSPARLTLYEKGEKRYFQLNEDYLEMLDSTGNPVQPVEYRSHWRLYKIK